MVLIGLIGKVFFPLYWLLKAQYNTSHIHSHTEAF